LIESAIICFSSSPNPRPQNCVCDLTDWLTDTCNAPKLLCYNLRAEHCCNKSHSWYGINWQCR